MDECRCQLTQWAALHTTERSVELGVQIVSINSSEDTGDWTLGGPRLQGPGWSTVNKVDHCAGSEIDWRNSVSRT